VEFSFIDEYDAVRLFNKDGDRIFPCPRSVIGRKVQDCHPKKSLHKLQQILDEMKAGTRDVAEFWIDHRGMKVHIRYFAVRESHNITFYMVLPRNVIFPASRWRYAEPS
jgi:DUF438 domain-containing protein